MNKDQCPSLIKRKESRGAEKYPFDRFKNTADKIYS